jgi:hypothetical protein
MSASPWIDKVNAALLALEQHRFIIRMRGLPTFTCGVCSSQVSIQPNQPRQLAECEMCGSQIALSPVGEAGIKTRLICPGPRCGRRS